MKFLHTSDLHIGRLLVGQKRDETFRQFFHWLVELCGKEEVDALIMSGDIFDSATPTHASQGIYYDFLAEMFALQTKPNVVVVGGNHDSPMLLNAPEPILRHLRMHVVGEAAERPEDEVFALRKTPDEDPFAVVCAVPYLRERNLTGNEDEDRDVQIAKATAAHYRAAVDEALRLRGALNNPDIPIIATGHLFAAGKSLSDEEQNLYVGTLGQIPGEAFPEEIDYLALGHIHKKGLVNKCETRRYCGTPIRLDFSSPKNPTVCLVTAEGRTCHVEEIPVPEFDRLESVSGSIAQITLRLQELIKEQAPIYVDVVYEGDEFIQNLASQVNEIVAGSLVEVLRCRDLRTRKMFVSTGAEKDMVLEDLTPKQMFEKRLEVETGMDEAQKDLARSAFEEILAQIASGNNRD